MAIIAIPQPLLVLLVIVALIINFCLLPFFGDILYSSKHPRIWKVIYTVFCVIVILSAIFFPFAKWILKLSAPILCALKYTIFSPLCLGVVGITAYLVSQVLASILLITFGYGTLGVIYLNDYIKELKEKRKAKRFGNLKSPSSWGGCFKYKKFFTIKSIRPFWLDSLLIL